MHKDACTYTFDSRFDMLNFDSINAPYSRLRRSRSAASRPKKALPAR